MIHNDLSNKASALYHVDALLAEWLVLVALGIVVACTPLVQIMLHDFLPSWMLDLN